MILEKLKGWDLDCGKKGYYDSQEDDLDDIKITERNITSIVNKLNEIVDWINSKNDQLL